MTGLPNARQYDYVARMGGDEFVIVAPVLLVSRFPQLIDRPVVLMFDGIHLAVGLAKQLLGI